MRFYEKVRRCFTRQRFLAAAILAAVAVPSAQATVLFAADRETAGPDGMLDTQAGFTSWSTGSSVTAGGITLTEVAQTTSQGLRDRGVPAWLSGDPMSDLLRDFDHSSGAGAAVIDLTLELSGLVMNTDYLVTLWGLDVVDNDGRGTNWYRGTDNMGTLLASFYNNNSAVPAPPPTLPLGQVFSQVFNTGGGTTLTFYGEGDFTVQGPPLMAPNTASVVIFNGLQVESVPVPGTLILVGIGLAGAGYSRRRILKA